MKNFKTFLPSLIFGLYVFFTLVVIWFLYSLKDLEWGQEGSFFEELGVVGLLLQYALGLANVLAINPVVIGLGLVDCGDSFLSLCFPTLYGVVFNLLFVAILIFVLNLVVVKLILRKRS